MTRASSLLPTLSALSKCTSNVLKAKYQKLAPEPGSVAASPAWALAAATLTLLAASPASCDEAEPRPDDVSNEHTAKFRIFSDKARRCTLLEQFDDAEGWWARAKSEAEAGWGVGDPHQAVIANGLAELYRVWGGERFKRAECFYKESIDITKDAYGEKDLRHAQAIQCLGQYYSNAGRHNEALATLRRSADIKCRILGKHHADYAYALSLIAEAHLAAGSTRAAIATFEQCLSVHAASGRDETSEATKVKARLVRALLEARRPERALEVLGTALNYARNVHITEHGLVARCLEHVVEALVAKRSGARALDAAKFMLQVREEEYGYDNANTALSRRLLATVQLASGSKPEVQAGLENVLHSVVVLRRTHAALTESVAKAAEPQQWWAFWRPENPDRKNIEFLKLRANACGVEFGRAAVLACHANALNQATPGQLETVADSIEHAIRVLRQAHELEPPSSDSAVVAVPTRQALQVQLRTAELCVAALDARTLLQRDHGVCQSEDDEQAARITDLRTVLLQEVAALKRLVEEKGIDIDL